MKSAQCRRADAMFAAQDGLATRAQLLAVLTEAEVRAGLRRGDWVVVARSLYGLPTWPDTPRRLLLAATLATGGVASHASAAWLWELLEEPPRLPVVTIAHGRHGRGATWLQTAAVAPRVRVSTRYSTDLSGAYVSHWKGVPTTNPLRTIVDLAGEAPPGVLDEAVDRGLVTRLVTLEGVIAESGRLKRHGRSGPVQLEGALLRRGFMGAPPASILEARLLRLFAAHKVPVLGTEVVVEEGHYRVDTQVAAHVVVETDGYAFHSSPEQKARDEARRNALKLQGLTVLVYGWRAVMQEGPRVCAEVLRAIEQVQHESRAPRGRGLAKLPRGARSA